MTRLQYISIVLIVINVILVISLFFVLPIYNRMERLSLEYSIYDYLKMILFLIDIISLYLIYKGKISGIIIILVTSLAMLFLFLYQNSFEVEVKATLLYCLIYFWDFLLLKFTLRKETLKF